MGKIKNWMMTIEECIDDAIEMGYDTASIHAYCDKKLDIVDHDYVDKYIKTYLQTENYIGE